MLRILLLSLIAAVALSAAPARALEGENLLVALPKGYKVGFTKKSDKEMITEMVPEAESVENWTEMVTVQIFYGLRDVTPAQYRARIEKLWNDACPGAKSEKLRDGTENLYPTALWSLTCPLNKQSGKPEYTWFKGVQGRDSFYLVQKAYKAEPTPKQLKTWSAFLDNAKVCDSRTPGALGQRCKLGK
jgi:hypothetical protein